MLQITMDETMKRHSPNQVAGVNAMAYITSCRNQAEPITTAHLTSIFSLYEKLSDRYLPYLTEKTTIAAMPERAMEYDTA